jgi:hypothetical protein
MVLASREIHRGVGMTLVEFSEAASRAVVGADHGSIGDSRPITFLVIRGGMQLIEKLGVESTGFT